MPTHSDDYLYGYADALNDQMNLQAFTKSKQYQRGYTDALHDTAFTYSANDLETF
jgi:hypothetical protein